MLAFHPLAMFAGTIKGTVRDSKGATLPFATVFLKGTTIGTAANANGEYQLSVSPGDYTIICQLISYRQVFAPVAVKGEEVVTKNFTMEAQNMELSSVTVLANDEDPAYRIMRKVLERRSFHLKQVKAFQSSIYLKGVLRTRKSPAKVFGTKVEARELGLDSAGKGVLYLCEEVADYYAQEPSKERTVIHSVRQSGNPNGFGFSRVPAVTSFYENNVDLGEGLNPRGFVSPLADGAFSFYRYKLQGEFTEDRHVIYKIGVTPKRQYEPLFSGYIYIVADDWAIHSLSLTTNGKLGIEFLDSLRIDQVFLPLKHDTWVVKSQLYYPVIDVLGFGITGNFVTVYDNQKVNEPVPDTIFHKKIVSQYDKDANKRDTGYWEETRPIPLEQDEARDYRYKDSIARHDTAFVYTDSLRRANNRKLTFLNLMLSGKTYNGYKNRYTCSFSPLLFSVNYNTVEGFNIEPQFAYTRRIDSSNSLRLKTALRYGFENTHFNPVAALSFEHRNRAWRGRGWKVMLISGKYVYQFNPDNPSLPLFNSFTTLVTGSNPMKIYERSEITPLFRWMGGNGLQFVGRFSYQERFPLENNLAYTFSNGKEATLTQNYPSYLSSFPFYQHKAAIAEAGISYQPGITYVLLPDHKRPVPSDAPTFSFRYTKGIPDLADSKVDYDKWRFGIDGSFRLRLLGSLSYVFSAGGFLNSRSVFAPDLTHIYEGDIQTFTLAAAYLKGFQLAPYYKYSNADPLYGEGHIEYDLHGLLSNKIPLLRQLKWNFILGSNVLYVNDRKNFTEAFLSIDNIGFKVYRFLRFDYVHAWDNEGRNYNGIRFGLRGITFVRGGEDTEW